jgi:hypothetical protein
MVPQSSTEQLLREMRWGVITAASYSRKSPYGRIEPLLRTVFLASAVVLTGILLGSPAPLSLRPPSSDGVSGSSPVIREVPS